MEFMEILGIHCKLLKSKRKSQKQYLAFCISEVNKVMNMEAYKLLGKSYFEAARRSIYLYIY